MKNIAAHFNISNSILGSKTNKKIMSVSGRTIVEFLRGQAGSPSWLKSIHWDRAVPSLQYILNSDILNSEDLNLEVRYGRS